MKIPRHFSLAARRSTEPPISWLMKMTLDRPRLISLAAGFTDNATLPVAEVRAITRQIFQNGRAARAALQYGSTNGLPELRQEILNRWRKQDGMPGALTRDDVVVTNGSQQLLYLVTQVLCDPGDLVLVEDPTYFVYLGIIEEMGIQARGFRSVADLKSKLEEFQARGLLPRLKMLYLVTYFRNPTGHTWTLAEKQETLALVKHYERAAGHPIYIIDDAAYRDLRFEGDDVASFKSLDRRNRRIVYANTLTKPFATGLKLGYGILPPELRQPVVRCKANHDFGSANFLQAILARALAGGLYAEHLPVIAAAYRRKRDALLDALAATAFRYEKPRGGLYVWAEAPGRVRTDVRGRLFQRALAAGVLYVPGDMCFCRDGTRPVPRNTMRLSFGTQSAAGIKKGIRWLADALESC